MRVSLRSQYNNFLYNMQRTQSRLMDLNLQASSQKRVNKPSDDPVGAGRVLNYRSSIAAINQYRSNIDTATGWLGLADESMLQVSTVLTRLRGLAEQGATGTLTASDRQATAYEVRQLFSQLVNLANTRFEGKSIFGGHKFEGSAYEEALMVHDQDGRSLGLATGVSVRSIKVQFLGNAGDTATVGGPPIACRYSSDGGTTWTETTVGVDGALDLGGVGVRLAVGTTLDLSPRENTKTSQGSWLTVAPAAVYKGDHQSQAAAEYTAGSSDLSVLPQGGFEKGARILVAAPAGTVLGDGTAFDVTVTAEVDGQIQTFAVQAPNTGPTCLIETPYGALRLSGPGELNGFGCTVHPGATGVLQMGSTVNAWGRGLFGSDVLVRIDVDADMALAEGITYSYSTDGGVNWSGGHSAAYKADGSAELLVPGGKLVLSERTGTTALAAGAQFVIHPQTAAHSVEISAGEYLQLNNVGSEVFGGHYEYGTQEVFAGQGPRDRNIMVTVGKLVAALENNDQQACAQALESLKAGQEYFTTQLASVGARENRLAVAGTVLSGLKLNETERMSNVEDADLATLLTELANQQLSYEAVLKSSSMIMKMSLVNYL